MSDLTFGGYRCNQSTLEIFGKCSPRQLWSADDRPMDSISKLVFDDCTLTAVALKRLSDLTEQLHIERVEFRNMRVLSTSISGFVPASTKEISLVNCRSILWESALKPLANFRDIRAVSFKNTALPVWAERTMRSHLPTNCDVHISSSSSVPRPSFSAKNAKRLREEIDQCNRLPATPEAPRKRQTKGPSQGPRPQGGNLFDEE